MRNVGTKPKNSSPSRGLMQSGEHPWSTLSGNLELALRRTSRSACIVPRGLSYLPRTRWRVTCGQRVAVWSRSGSCGSVFSLVQFPPGSLPSITVGRSQIETEIIWPDFLFWPTILQVCQRVSQNHLLLNLFLPNLG